MGAGACAVEIVYGSYGVIEEHSIDVDDCVYIVSLNFPPRQNSTYLSLPIHNTNQTGPLSAIFILSEPNVQCTTLHSSIALPAPQAPISVRACPSPPRTTATG
ncbi:hypothetical protein IAQ61_009226 [Plenodomus lingam]|uniref:uncharacterized protein n=1 Tax=Leptosphaeria maculans TaxID=5022 RepID=UPI0033324132|nr:hypothetical protein IAQ61_009226 [Plenodomus lingam]